MSIVKMPSGDKNPLKVPVPKNMLDSHLKGKLNRKSMKMVTVIIADGQVHYLSFRCNRILVIHHDAYGSA